MSNKNIIDSLKFKSSQVKIGVTNALRQEIKERKKSDEGPSEISLSSQSLQSK